MKVKSGQRPEIVFGFNFLTGLHFTFISLIFFYCLFLLGCDRIDRASPPSPKNGNAAKNILAENSSLQKAYLSILVDLRRIFGEQEVPSARPFIARIESLSLMVEGLHSPDSWIDGIIHKVYTEWETGFDMDRNNLQALLPHTILQRKKGSCLGVSLLFLLLAEKWNYPVFGVLLPGHFFIRYDDGNHRRNIEPNLKGHQHPDSYYFSKYIRKQNSRYDMRNLDKAESMAAFYYNIGNICRIRGKHSEAIRFYRKCLEAMSGFAEAWGNLAITCAAQNMTGDARKAFIRAETLDPGLMLLSRNFGAFELQNRRYKDAAVIFHRGLSHFPEDEELFYGLALANFHLGRRDSASHYLGRISNSSPVFHRAARLLELLSADEK